MIFKKILLGLVLFGFYQLASADAAFTTFPQPTPGDLALSINNIGADKDVLAILSVVNADNTTSIYVKTLNGKNLLLWQHKPIYRSTYFSFTTPFYADRSGDFLTLSGDDGINVADLKQNRITTIQGVLLAFSSDGISVQYYGKNITALIVKPFFGSCPHPTILYLSKKYTQTQGFKILGPNIQFTDPAHLEVDYMDQFGGPNGSQIFDIDSAKISAQCVSGAAQS